MGIQFETDYNMETLTAMAKSLRKTVRKKRSRRVHIFAAVVLILGLLTILATTAGGEPLGASGVVTLLAMLVVILVSLFEDKLNAWFARKRLLPGTEHAAATFEEDGYVSATGVTESRFPMPRSWPLPRRRATSSLPCPRTIRRRMTRGTSAAGASRTSVRLSPKRRESSSKISNKSNIVQKIGENQ